MTTTTTSCISTPVSWLRLESFAAGAGDAAVREHVDACPACRQCLDDIERDVVALPMLVVPPVKRMWRRFALPALGAIAVAALVLVLIRPRDPVEEGLARVKGLGTVELDLIRERAGTTRADVRSFAAGDRWKVVVTCPPDRPVWLDAFVLEHGAKQPDYPLAPTRVVCGNRIILPGAFELTGAKPHRVCLRISTTVAPVRATGPGMAADVACVTVRPE